MMIGETFADGLGAGVTSFTNGLGSLGGILEGPIIGFLSQNFGWNSVILCMIFMCVVTMLATFKAHLVVTKQQKLDLKNKNAVLQA